MYASNNLENTASRLYQSVGHAVRKLVAADYEGSAGKYKPHKTAFLIAGGIAAVNVLGIINFPTVIDLLAYCGTIYNGARALKDKKQVI